MVSGRKCYKKPTVWGLSNINNIPRYDSKRNTNEETTSGNHNVYIIHGCYYSYLRPSRGAPTTVDCRHVIKFQWAWLFFFRLRVHCYVFSRYWLPFRKELQNGIERSLCVPCHRCEDHSSAFEESPSSARISLIRISARESWAQPLASIFFPPASRQIRRRCHRLRPHFANQSFAVAGFPSSDERRHKNHVN